MNEAPTDLLSLPRGGGALVGLGETFEPDLQMGTGNLSVPISAPSGRGGFGPRLSLTYSTGKGNGPFGIGWDLAVPSVARRTRSGFPRYDDSDVIVLGGLEDLVAVPGGPAGTVRYRPDREGLFARIERHVGTDDYWEIASQDGTRTRYGTIAAEIPAGQPDPASIAPRPGATFAWLTTVTTDPFGNRIEYRYSRDPGAPVDAPESGQLLLDRITYADYGVPTDVKFLVEIRFVYEDRPDPITDYSAGFALMTTLRCTRIEVVSGPGATAPSRVYHLRYLDPTGSPDAPVNGASLLGEVRAEGRDGPDMEWLPPLEFGYTRFKPERRDLRPVRGAGLPLGSPGAAPYVLADTSGDGLPDLVSINHGVRVWRNTGSATFGLPREVRNAPTHLSLSDGTVDLLDADGDGRLDLVATTPMAGYWPLRFDEQWDPRSFHRYTTPPSFSARDPLVRLLDLDRDGVTDALRSGTRLESFFSNGDGAWRKDVAAPRRDLADFPNVTFDDPRVRVADMVGDGGRAIVLIHPGRVDYWPIRDRGAWDGRVTMLDGPDLPLRWDPRYLLLGDVDGDGAADLVQVESGRVNLWMNRGGRSWSPPITIDGTPPVNESVSVQLVDLLGNGIAGVLWTADRSPDRDGSFFLDLTGGTKPYLLDRIDNHTGARTLIEYESSTRYRLTDDASRATRWRTSMPFPVHVVKRVETVDQHSGGKLTTEYAYHHGYWDGREREFRGFGRVDRRDSESAADYAGPGLHGPGTQPANLPDGAFAPPLETRTWFHLGDVTDAPGRTTELDYDREFWTDDPPALGRPGSTADLLSTLSVAGRRTALRTLRGRILRTERYGLDGDARADRPFEVTEYAHGIASLPVGTALADPPEDWQLETFFPYEAAERTTVWDRGADPLTRLRFLDDYDAYGHARSQLDIAVPRGRDYRTTLPASVPHEPYLASRTVSAFAGRDDALIHLVDRVASVTTTTLDLARYETVRGESPAAAAIPSAILDGLVDEEVIAQTVSFFDGDAFEGLPFGEIGAYGAVTRRERLALTDDVLERAYRNDGGTTWKPSYLETGPGPRDPIYPTEFLANLQPLAGFVERSGGLYAGGLYAMTERRAFDFHDPAAPEVRGLITTIRSPLGYDTSVGADPYRLMPASTTDAAGLVTEATIDYRVFQATDVTDSNGNRTVFTYTPWGLLRSIARIGQGGVGDTTAEPSTAYEYDFAAFDDRGEPISVRTTTRIHHVTDVSVPEPDRSATVERRDYCDGFGRILQTRTLVDEPALGDPAFGDAGLSPDPSVPIGPAVASPATSVRVRIDGWQTYDNKGRVMERFEPAFGTGWSFEAPTTTRSRTRFYYDATGSAIRTVGPDGAEQRIVRGVPDTIGTPDLSDPTNFEPTPWEAYVYDANDNLARTHPLDPRRNRLEPHLDTPTSAVRDALGRTVASVGRCRARRPDGTLSPIEEARTTFQYDLAANLVEARDALGRVAVRNVHALDGTLLRAERLDGGVRMFVPDATGTVIEARDSRGAIVLRSNDRLGRSSRRWARDESAADVILRERLDYGDAGTDAQTTTERESERDLNRLGRLVAHHDEAGVRRVERYDHRGNAVETVRRVIRDERFEDVFTSAAADAWRVGALRIDWTVPAGSTLADRESELLSDASYATSLVLDALDRPTTITAPANDGSTGPRSVTQLDHDLAGRVRKLEVDGRVVVELAAYDARGAPILVTHPATTGGFGLMRRFAYDETTGWLARLRSERFVHPAGFATTWQPSSPTDPALDLVLERDLVGTLLGVTDRSFATSWGRSFAYDSLSRLVSETSRECATGPTDPWFDSGICPPVGSLQDYTEQFSFDLAGNVTQIRHQVGSSVAVKDITLSPGTNRIASMASGANTFDYRYDDVGNLIRETTSRHFEWDHSGRLRAFRQQTKAAGAGPDDDMWAEPSLHVHYLYDAFGERVQKVVRHQGGAIEVTVAIGDQFEHHRWTESGAVKQSSRVHAHLAGALIATDRRGDVRVGDTSPAFAYHHGDQLGSSVVTTDAAYAVVDRERYSAFGRTEAGGTTAKRFRFAGKARDEESGLGFFGARYYAPWLARWVSCDPAPSVDDLNPYVYARNNPASRRDTDGRQSRSEAADNIGVMTMEGAGAGEAPLDENWALPRFPKTTPVAPPAEDEEKEERRGLLGTLFDYLTREPDKPPGPPKPPSAPPPPPPVIAGPVFSDAGTAYELEGDEYKHWPRIFRRVPTSSPDELSIESSSDSGRTWAATGKTVGVFSGPGLTPEELAQRDLERAAEAERDRRIGSVVAGALFGLMNFVFVALVLALLRVPDRTILRMLPWGLLGSVAVGAVVGYGMSMRDTAEPAEAAPQTGDYTMQL